MFEEVIKIKVAIITDIHGNYIALQEVIKDAEKNNVDEYVFLGDLITEFPFNNETLDTVKSLSNNVLKGNKEQYIIEYEKEKYDWKNIQFLNSKYFYNSLRKDNLEYIKKLPHTLDVEFDGVKLRLAHGSPESVQELINENDDEKLDKYTKNLDADGLIIGHTHKKMWKKIVNNKIVVNAGCCGVSPFYTGKAEYVILEIESGKIKDIKFNLVDYDIEKLKEEIRKSGILDVEKVLINLTYAAVSGNGEMRFQFFRDANALMLEKYGKMHKDNATGIYKYFKLYDDEIWLKLAEKYKEYFVL
jgi:putative phosphoesterase